MKRIRKAVLPVAGLGTRFLPATKAVPKEMLTVVDHVLHDGAVDHGQHLLRHRLGGRKEPGAEAGDGKNGFANALHRGAMVRGRAWDPALGPGFPSTAQ